MPDVARASSRASSLDEIGISPRRGEISAPYAVIATYDGEVSYVLRRKAKSAPAMPD